MSGCPSCGRTSGYGPDEDGEENCLGCGGPHYCPACGDPIINDALHGNEGWSCAVCGETYHEECFPTTSGGTDILCNACIGKPRDPMPEAA